MIQTKPKKYSFIFYENERSPRFYEIGQGLLRLILIGLPTLALMSLIAVAVVGVYFKEIREKIVSREPVIINQLKTQNENLKNEALEYKGLNQSLQEKLSSKSTGTTGSGQSETLNGALSFFLPSIGQADLTKQPSLQVNDLKYSIANSKLVFTFNIANVRNDGRRVSGHLFLLMQDGDTIHRYPTLGPQGDSGFAAKFNSGESFATSRFRPFKTKFPAPKTQRVHLKIIIFSRTGDLIHHQEFTNILNG